MTTLFTRIQARLSEYYGIEDAPPVDDFIQPSCGERESLVVRYADGEVEMALYVPSRATTFDELCQIIEGVSHYLCVAERARRELPITELELELQAEVDKYVLLAHEPIDGFDPGRATKLRSELFDRVRYVHAVGTERGDRYRLANWLAARFSSRLELRFARSGRLGEMRSALQRFYGAGLTDKVTLALAA